MNKEQRIQVITERLQKKFSPSKLDVQDDSDKHIGHAGSQGGAGHYTVIIQSNYFANFTRVDAHREIYTLLNDLIPHEIHALRIIISSNPQRF